MKILCYIMGWPYVERVSSATYHLISFLSLLFLTCTLEIVFFFAGSTLGIVMPDWMYMDLWSTDFVPFYVTIIFLNSVIS